MKHRQIRRALLAVAIFLVVGLWSTNVVTSALADEALPQNATVASQAEELPEQESQLGQESQPELTEQGSDEEQGAEESTPAPAGSESQPTAQEEAEHTHDGVAFTATDTLPDEPGNYYLTADVTITNTWSPKDGTSLCLNGHTITVDIDGASDGGSAVMVTEGVTFGLYDCGDGMLQPADGKVISYGVNSNGGATFNMYGGTIKGFLSGVQTDLTSKDSEQGTPAKFGTFNMYGGTITGCTSHGVHVFSGTFNMGGGLITQNASEDDGAGVYVQYSAFTMTGGEISNNVAKGNGGGLYVFRTTDVAISGGSITGNSALGTGQAPGDEVGNGGGVYVSANPAVPATLTVTGGTIADNTASNLGGGVYVDADAILKTSGAPKIVGNSAAGKASNVHLGAKPITVTDKLEDGASMGVTLASDAFGLKTAADASTDAPVFTAGYKEKGSEADPQAYFSSDDEDYLVGWSEDSKEARLVTAYNVLVEEAKNGTVTASAAKARAGDTVTLAITPSDGYRLASLAVLDANKKAVEVTDGVFTMPSSDVTVSATFEETHHTITFEANGGTGTMDDQVVETGESVALNANKYTRSGYTFNHWNTKEDGSGTSYKNGATITPAGDMTLYAQWKKNGASSTTSTPSTSTTSTGTTKTGTASTGAASTGTTSTSTLARTADITSAMGAVAMLVAGAGTVHAGIRRRHR